MKVQRKKDMLHPLLIECVGRIQKDVIDAHNIPMRLFETGRTQERHMSLVKKGREFSLVSPHVYDLENQPPLYCSAVNYVYFDKRWSWNMRDSTIKSWFNIFGNLVLDICPELTWGGAVRKNINYSLFILKPGVMKENWDRFPCVLP